MNDKLLTPEEIGKLGEILLTVDGKGKAAKKVALLKLLDDATCRALLAYRQEIAGHL